MAIRYLDCGACGKSMKADLKDGQRVRCPHCKEVLGVPPPPVEEICQNCRFYSEWRAGYYKEGTYKFGRKKGQTWVRSTPSSGKCKAEAPNVVIDRPGADRLEYMANYVNNRFPDTSGGDWCGRFQAR